MEEIENIAQTLARELPQATQLAAIGDPETHGAAPSALLFNLPAGQKIETVDLEKYRAHPSRADGTAKFSEAESFLAYVKRHASTDSTVVWCDFDPRSYALSFTAVFDDHALTAAGWRKHRAVFKPAPSVEWGIWTGANKKPMAQVEFAEFLENNHEDITGTPTSTDMLQMATQFEIRQDQALKSAVRLQSGGVELQYIANDDTQTVERMKLFDEFRLGIPVFWGNTTGEMLKAKLRYRQQQSKVTFWYELQRPDKAHEQAAREMIQRVRDGIEGLPLLMGNL